MDEEEVHPLQVGALKGQSFVEGISILDDLKIESDFELTLKGLVPKQVKQME